jgi:hypothetical protein
VSDADSLFCRCEACQFFCSPETCTIPLATDHTNNLTFFTWGLDLVGPFKKAKGGFTRIFVAVNNFTKWIKVKPVASITIAKVVEFIREIITGLAYPTTLSPIMGLSSL